MLPPVVNQVAAAVQINAINLTITSNQVETPVFWCGGDLSSSGHALIGSDKVSFKHTFPYFSP